MRRYPIAALVAILSLGFGIGATTVTLTVRDTIFRKAPPLYREPANISRVEAGTPTNRRHAGRTSDCAVRAVAGGLFGVAATLALRGIIVRNGSPATFYDLSLEPRVLAITAIITLLTGVVAGLAPALYETRRLHGNPLRSMGAADRVRQRWRQALVVFEITVTIALLVQMSALVDGYRRAMSADLGFATAPLVTARVENSAGVQVAPLLDAIRALPGVQTAAVSTSIPFGARGASMRVTAGGSSSAEAEAINTEHAQITPSFFSALGVSIRAGRPFADGEPHTMHTVRLVGAGVGCGLGARPPSIQSFCCATPDRLPSPFRANAVRRLVALHAV
jgi:putative ABC transport system permease protein